MLIFVSVLPFFRDARILIQDDMYQVNVEAASKMNVWMIALVTACSER